MQYYKSELWVSIAAVAADVFLDSTLECVELLFCLNEERTVLVHEASSHFYEQISN